MAVAAAAGLPPVEFAVLVQGSQPTAEQLAQLLRAEGLIVESTSVRSGTQWLLLVGLPVDQASVAAEKVGLLKLHRSGYERRFVLEQWRDFGSGDENRPQELFSLAERQEIVQSIMDSIRASQITEVVGLDQRCVLVHPGQSVLAVCQKAGVVAAMFPPHDYEMLSNIRHQWLSHLTIPVHMIKAYFGIRVAFYYAFLSFYTWSLLMPMTVGVSVLVHMDSLAWRIAGVLFNLLWNTVILEVWRKRADHLSCFWGLHEVQLPHQNRLLFAFDESRFAQRAFRVIVSQAVVLLCVFLCVLQQYQYLTLEAYVSGTFPSPTIGDAVIRMLPGVVNTMAGMAFSDVYRALIQRLTEWENHQTQAEYLQHLTGKLIVFDFLGRFGSLFYTAFYLQDIPLLRKQVYILLALAFTKENLIEVVMPRAMRHFSSVVRSMIRSDPSYLPGIHSVLSEADMTRYTSTYVDYYKMFSQFAFVFLFGPVVPLAPMIAFFGNLLEMLIVGYKLTVVFQRPLKPAFQVIGFLAVPSNIALICVENADPLHALLRLFTDMEFVLFLVCIEHAIMLLKLLLQYAIRSKPHCPHYGAHPAP
ncbi:hypothetical protein HPB48_016050 [Haemaphysalis longicornis]|uniref:Anoctamin n=1 Tax=Haemaphysalis longicornis TaxID=44386 RepID=A0A9J6GJY7_HAELO|nr:hypothetical protein HPB48_016050 [Haemaphysalis longicornis]